MVGEPDSKLVRSMKRVRAHRGPDGKRFFTSQGVATGHWRLSIVDLVTGQQPMRPAVLRSV
ncbi:MAG: hypothetical protein ABSG32_01560 [Terriglobia bacterium]|jgi:asparagine synthase (glutamine-hydrolysing)